MKKNPAPPTAQDYDRKRGRDAIPGNPRVAKDVPAREPADKREAARHEHTNHFTNRAGKKKK